MLHVYSDLTPGPFSLREWVSEYIIQAKKHLDFMTYWLLFPLREEQELGQLTILMQRPIEGKLNPMTLIPLPDSIRMQHLLSIFGINPFLKT